MLHILSFSWSRASALGPGFFWVNVLHRLCSCKRFSIAIFDPSNRFARCVMLRSLTRFFFLVCFLVFCYANTRLLAAMLLATFYLFIYVPFFVARTGFYNWLHLCGETLRKSRCRWLFVHVQFFLRHFFRVLLRNSSCFFCIVWPNR